MQVFNEVIVQLYIGIITPYVIVRLLNIKKNIRLAQWVYGIYFFLTLMFQQSMQKPPFFITDGSYSYWCIRLLGAMVSALLCYMLSEDGMVKIIVSLCVLDVTMGAVVTAAMNVDRFVRYLLGSPTSSVLDILIKLMDGILCGVLVYILAKVLEKPLKIYRDKNFGESRYMGLALPVFAFMVCIWIWIHVNGLVFSAPLQFAVICCWGAIFVFVGASILYENVITVKRENTYLKQQEKETQQYYEHLQADIDKMKKFRHDLKKHMSILQYLQEHANSESDEEHLRQYCSDLAEAYRQLAKEEYSTYPAVNALINEKIKKCKEKGITLELSVGQLELGTAKEIEVVQFMNELLEKSMERTSGSHIVLHAGNAFDQCWIKLEFDGKLKKSEIFRIAGNLMRKHHGNLQVDKEEHVTSIMWT